MGVCSHSRRPVKREERKLDRVTHSESHSPEIPFLQFGPISLEFHNFPEHHQRPRPRVSNIWTQGTFYIQVNIDRDISGVLWKNNNKTKQIVNLAHSRHIKKEQWRKSTCLRQAAWLKFMKFPSIWSPLRFNNKEKAMPKGWCLGLLVHKLSRETTNCEWNASQLKVTFWKFTNSRALGLVSSSSICFTYSQAVDAPFGFCPALLIGSRFVRENWKVIQNWVSHTWQTNNVS